MIVVNLNDFPEKKIICFCEYIQSLVKLKCRSLKLQYQAVLSTNYNGIRGNALSGKCETHDLGIYGQRYHPNVYFHYTLTQLALTQAEIPCS